MYTVALQTDASLLTTDTNPLLPPLPSTHDAASSGSSLSRQIHKLLTDVLVAQDSATGLLFCLWGHIPFPPSPLLSLFLLSPPPLRITLPFLRCSNACTGQSMLVSRSATHCYFCSSPKTLLPAMRCFSFWPGPLLR